MTDNNLAVRFPELAAEWHTDRNEGASPADFTCGSGKKVWWKCAVCGNEWMATVNHRTNGGGCPACARKSRSEKLSKKNLIPGKTDLATCYPHIANQWHAEKNGALAPMDVSPCSDKKVWWVCPIGHDYQMRIVCRTAQNQGCPICAGKQILEGFNDLKSQYPEIAAQWDYDRNEKGPETYAAHSNKKVFWLCEKNHSYLAAIAERTGKAGHGTGCPYCAGKKVLPGFNDLATVRPELAAEWDYEENENLLPTGVTEFSMKSIHWICRCGHKWITAVAWRSQGNGCPVCANLKLLKGYNDIATLFPEVAKDWDDEKNDTCPEDHIAGTHKKVWWKCSECGNSWYASIKERTYGKTGCPRCTFYHKTSFPEQAILFYARKCFPDAVNSYKPSFLAPQEIDIFIPKLNLAIEYDGRQWHKNAERDYEKSQKIREHGMSLLRMREKGLPAVPESDHTVESSFFQGDFDELTCELKALFQKAAAISGADFDLDIDVQRDFGEIKAAYEGTKQEKSLLYANPEVLREWNYQKNGPLTPEKVTPHSRAVVWWKCSRCGKEWQQSVKTKVLGGLRCENCSKSDAVLRRMKDRAQAKKAKTVAEFPLLLEEWDFDANAPLIPEHVTYGSERKLAWICKTCGNHFAMRVKARTRCGQGCPLCGRKKSAQTRSEIAKKNKEKKRLAEI